MQATSAFRPHNDSRRNTVWVLPVVVSCLIAAVLSIRRSPNEPASADETQGTTAALPADVLEDVLEEDFEILRVEFRGYVLPLERARLAIPLTRAIESNDETEVLRLLELGADADWSGPEYSRRSDTRAPLFRAIKRGNLRIVEALLQRGARVGGPTPVDVVASRNQFSQTPLYFAVRCRNREIVDLLLKYGAMVSASNGYNKTPIVGTVEEADFGMFKHLRSKGAVCNFESMFREDRVASHSVLHEYPDEYFVAPFSDKCSDSSFSLMELARQSGNAELITAVNEQFERSPEFRPDLQAVVAVRLNDANSLRRLIAGGYDASKYEPKYSHAGTLLDLAASLNRAECFEVLKQSGVKQTKVAEKDSPLRLLVASGSVEQLKQRLAQGSEFGPYKPTQGSPLRLAVRAQQEAMVRFLLKRPEANAEWLADPLLLLTALPYLRNNHRLRFSSAICRTLIEAGASIRSKPVNKVQPDENPLIRAASAGWRDVYEMLAEREPALVNDSKALQSAAYANQTAMCQALLSRGADPNSRELPHRKSPLDYAMFNRNGELVQLLIEAGAKKAYPEQLDVSKGYAHFEEYAHPLYHAALVGDTNFCNLLIQQFPPAKMWQALQHEPYEYDNDIQYFDKGNTPLFAAIYGDHVETLRLLLAQASQIDENGEPVSDIDARNKFGATALHEAVIYGSSKCAQLLLAAGADITIPRFPDAEGRGDTPLHLATHSPFAAHMHERLQHGPDVDAIFPMLVAANIRHDDPGWLNRKNKQGATPLHNHARAGHRAACQKLLALGADANAVSDVGDTPLLSAIIGRYPMHPVHESKRKYRSRICLDLVEAGAKFDEHAGRFKTSYYTVAYRFGLYDLCDALLARGVAPNIQADAGEYLCSAVKHQRLDLLKQLIEAGADVNARDSQKNTALHLAASAHDFESCQRLLADGSDPNLKDDQNRTALFCVFYRFLNHVKQFASSDPRATQEKAYRLLQLLLNAGANPNAKGTHKNVTILKAYDNMPVRFRQLVEAKIEAITRANQPALP